MNIREVHAPLPGVQEDLHGALRHPGVRHRRDSAFDTHDLGAGMNKQASAESRRESPELQYRGHAPTHIAAFTAMEQATIA